MIGVINDVLFRCTPWDDEKHFTIANSYKIIVSDVVYGNDTRSTIQVHIGVKKRGIVVKVKDLIGKEHITTYTQIVEQIESIIRKCMINIVSWKGESQDDNVVKIWYYRPEDDPDINNHGEPCSDLYLRISATAVDLCPLDSDTEQQLTNELGKRLGEFICQKI